MNCAHGAWIDRSSLGFALFMRAVVASVPGALIARFAKHFGTTVATVTNLAADARPTGSAPDAALTARLRRALWHVSAVCSEHGRAALLATAGRHRERLGAIGAAELSFRMYLDDHEAFGRARCELAAGRLMGATDFWSEHLSLGRAPTADAQRRIIAAVRKRFGEHSSVSFYDRDSELAMAVTHVDVASGAFSKDILKVDKKTARLSVTTDGEHCRFYCGLVGGELFRSPENYAQHPTMSLDSLRMDPEQATCADGLPLVKSVELDTLYLMSPSAPTETTRKRGFSRRFIRQDVQRALESGGEIIQRAEFVLRLTGNAHETRVNIAPSGVLSYDRKTSEAGVREFLRMRFLARFANHRGGGGALAR